MHGLNHDSEIDTSLLLKLFWIKMALLMNCFS